MSFSDPYEQLRPQRATPPDEMCKCTGQPPVMLRSVLSPNPLACFACNLEVAPERLALPQKLAETVASWASFHDCFYLLWLDSGEFEEWAKVQLESPMSPVNRRGLEVASELSQHRECYYWWFATCDESYDPPDSCLLCGGQLVSSPRGRVCQSCRVIFADQP
jgi:hypothetical protein